MKRSDVALLVVGGAGLFMAGVVWRPVFGDYTKLKDALECSSFLATAIAAIVAIYTLSAWKDQFRHSERFKSLKDLKDAATDLHALRGYLLAIERSCVDRMRSKGMPSVEFFEEEEEAKKKWLAALHWRALLAKYSTHDERKHGAILELLNSVKSPAPKRFRECAILIWAIPQVAGTDGKRSAAVLPASWYDITNWDNDGKPESTRYRWRSSILKSLDDLVNEALTAAQEIMDAEGLIESCAA